MTHTDPAPTDRVLVVADDGDSLEPVARLLAERFDVRIAAHAADAVERLRGGEAEVVVAAVAGQQPQAHGLVDSLRRASATAAIVVTTATPHDAESSAAAADAWLAPPLDGRELGAAVRGAARLARERRLFADRDRALRQAADRATTELDRILSSVGEGFAALDAEFRYVYVNDAAVRLVGIPREAAVGRTPWDLFPRDVADDAVTRLREAVEHGRPVRYELYLPHADRWYENRAYPTAGGVSLFFSDITARRQADEALQRTQAAQRLLIAINDATRYRRNPADVMTEASALVGRHFAVTRCTYGEIDVGQEHVIVIRDYTDGVVSIAGRHRLDDFGPTLIAELRAGRTVAVDDVERDPRTSGAGAVASFAAIETRSLLCVPLVKEGRFVALFVLHHREPRRWAAHDVSLMEQVAERTWFALENARAEAALRESRDVLSLAMRGGRMGAWARNLRTNEVWWSHELGELLGLEPGTFSGTHPGFRALVHEDDIPRLESAVSTALATGDDYVVEIRVRHADGSWRWLEGRGRAVYDEGGVPRMLYGLGIDITGRKEAERALAAARDAADAERARLNLALDAASLGDWSWDTTTDMVTFSPRAAEIFGILPGPQVTWTAMRELLHPDDRDRVRVAVEQALASGANYGAEYRLINGGQERWVQASGRTHHAEDGRLLGMFGVVQDVTPARLLLRLDDAVRRLTEPEGITYEAARTLGEHLRVDRCAYAHVEADEDTFELTGNYTNGVASIVGRYTFGQFGAECLRLMRAGLPYVVEDSEVDSRIADADREAYRATAIRAVVCVPILKGGRFVAAMAVHAASVRRWQAPEVELVEQVASRCWESIERARVERQRVALLEAAEAANRAKDEFLAMLGHELRNPLSPILTALQLMKLRGEGPSRERSVIERQVAHLARLVDDLLDVSRIARGKVELKPDVVDLADVVARGIETASPLLEQQEHRLVVDVPRGLTVWGDPARLSQVVSNLLMNAAKYTPRSGRIVVAATGADGEIVLRVTDTGIGIPDTFLSHVFDLFVQGPQALDRAEGGLGLGLAIVKSLVERHGGRVSAHSEGLHRGSEFVVTLPMMAAPPVEPTPEPKVPAPARMSGRILIVDDNRDAAEMLAAALETIGFATVVAHDGLAGLERAGRELFDAALVDIGLPVMDGYELAARLKELPGGDALLLIAVTGYGQDSDRRRTAAAGFHHHLVKPVDVDALAGVLATLQQP